jgi:anti-sigma factor RsiW
MSCPSFDWKAYALNSLDAEERREAETHAAACSSCRLELATLRLTLDALSSLREEEVPRRIAFVSDKVFEPRWWQVFLRPSFAAAVVLALAIVVHGFLVRTSVDAAVAKAVTQVQEQNQKQMAGILADYELFSKQLTRMYAMNTGLVRQ